MAGFPASACESIVEDRILNWIDEAVRCCGFQASGVSCFADLIGPNALLATVPQFDHYQRSVDPGHYLGIWDRTAGTSPLWTSSNRPRVFAYLKPHPNVGQLLTEVTRQGFQVAIASDVRRIQNLIPRGSNSIALQHQLVSLEQIAETCQFVITNANHGTTVRLLMYGLPVLACPLFIEQQVTAQRISQLGLGRQASLRSPGQFASAISHMNAPSVKNAVDSFSQQHKNLLDGTALERAMLRINRFIEA